MGIIKNIFKQKEKKYINIDPRSVVKCSACNNIDTISLGTMPRGMQHCRKCGSTNWHAFPGCHWYIDKITKEKMSINE